MLPRRHRLTDRTTFAAAVRSGRRIPSGALVGHLMLGSDVPEPRVGLIVSKKVGSAVARHRVARVIRHAAASHLSQLPPGAVLVVRALPTAAQRDSALGADMAALFERVERS